MPRWRYTVDISAEFQAVQNETGPVSAVVNRLISELKKIPVDGADIHIDALENLLEGTGEGNLDNIVVPGEDVDPDDFDEVFDEVYDWADENRVWIKTF